MQVETGRQFMGRFPKGADLLQSINDFCARNGIRAGQVSAIGAVAKARIGFYDQESLSYDFLDIASPTEILSLMANISLKDGQPFAHVHVILGGHDGAALGGHLAAAEIFALEYVIREFKGQAEFVRGFEEATALPLWPLED